MGQGDSQITTPRAALRRVRAFGPLALLAGAALGCSDGGAGSQHDLPPLPHDWQGAINAPSSDAWAAGEPWRSPGPSATAPYGTPYAMPYTTPYAEAAPYAPVRVARVEPVVASPSPSPELLEPADEVAATPASESDAAEAPAELLAPESIPADEPTPAPGDVLVVAQMPSLAAPSPADIAAAARMQQPPVAPTAITPTPEAPEPVAIANAATVQSAASNPATPTTPTPPAMQSAASPTGAVVNERAAARIRRGHELADRGAYFAARSEFLATLQMIAEAKDQIHGAPRRTIALADGLRALDEAADFSPAAIAGAGDLAMSVIVASHRTPAAKELAVDEMLPQQLADAYFRYAETQLASAVAGEPAGSMALHALGKLNSQLGRVEPANNPQADARAFALQQAALLARPDNHLAAHELGVLLAESGHYIESDQLLRQVAARAPHAVVFRNLARVERRLGRPDLAQASEQQANFLASRGADAGSAVTWVAAIDLARTPDASGAGSAPMNMAAPSAVRPGVGSGVPAMARGPASFQR